MSIRNLDALLAPRSVAVVGASDRPGNLGGIVVRNMLEAGFAGSLWAEHPRGEPVAGVAAFTAIDALPSAPDLAVICTPAATVPGLVADLGRKGTRAAVVITAGLKAPSADGSGTLEQAMLDAARPWVLRILGPNCIGALAPGVGLNASFAPGSGLPGQLAFVTQSGALATAMLDWAGSRGIGFSHFISLGDSADVDFGDMLDALANDAGTSAILLYIESVRHARKFMSAARAAARNKPVILVKAGRAAEGARAAASHTGALAGSDAVFDAAVRRAGMVRVDTLEALYDAAETLAHPHPWRGERLAVVTNGGGAGVLAADAVSLGGGTLATLAPSTLAALDAVLPANWSHGNPVDLVGDAPVSRYEAALRVVLAAPEVDGVLFMHAPTAIVPALEIAQACLPLLQKADKPVLSAWLGGRAVEGARQAFAGAGQPCYGTPEQAVAGWLQLAQYHAHQRALLELPDAQPADIRADSAAAGRLLAGARAQGREWLDDAESLALLAAYGIPTVATRRVRDVEEAMAAAMAIGFPVALKIVSPQIQHKTEVGGVALQLASTDDVRLAANRMLQTVASRTPDARITGFTVQAMATRKRPHELIVGIATDPVFGPAVLFGAGGTSVEVRRDRALDLPPLNPPLARALVARTRVGALLAPHRGQPGVDEAALLDTLLRISQLACDLPAVAELDINPLLADAQGVLALDARVRLRLVVPAAETHLALRPYPAALERNVTVDGTALLVRPIRPDDGKRLAAFHAASPLHELRLRSGAAEPEVPLPALARYCQIDYDREMTFVALQGDAMVGEVRSVCDPDNVQARFSVHVAPSWQRRGLGRHLTDGLVAYLRTRGTRELVGSCLQEDAAMAALARRLGFEVNEAADGTMALRLRLQADAAALADAPVVTARITSEAVNFASEGTLCAGRIWRPAAPGPAPAVLLANGLSGTQDWIVPDFARRFAEAGVAAMVFDYRYHGGSGGRPRQVVDSIKQREDLRAALRCLREQPGIDGTRVALWGTSLGGSHVVEVAAQDGDVAAVVCTMPALDAVRGANLQAKLARSGVGRLAASVTTLRLLAAAVHDALRGALRLTPRYLDVYGRPGEALFTDPALAHRFNALTAGSASWTNRVAARFLLRAPRYRSGTLERIHAPILFSLAADDMEVSSAFLKELAAGVPRTRVMEYACGHFDLYHGEMLERVAHDQAMFLADTLGVAVGDGVNGAAASAATG